jgi:hypothetical protein
MEYKIKHLEMIQKIIARMAHNSFLLKGWAVTLIGALFALSQKEIGGGIVLIAVMLIVMFWGLDAYYLSKEHLFRILYEEVRLKNPDDIDFAMMPTEPRSSYTDIIVKLSSPTQLYFYGVLVLIVFMFNYFM